jgi:hypothetical protein
LSPDLLSNDPLFVPRGSFSLESLLFDLVSIDSNSRLSTISSWSNFNTFSNNFFGWSSDYYSFYISIDVYVSVIVSSSAVDWLSLHNMSFSDDVLNFRRSEDLSDVGDFPSPFFDLSLPNCDLSSVSRGFNELSVSIDFGSQNLSSGIDPRSSSFDNFLLQELLFDNLILLGSLWNSFELLL